MQPITAIAPGKVILFGEHAINRGQPALATAVGLYARCTLCPTNDALIHLRSGKHQQTVTPSAIAELGAKVEGYRTSEAFESIRQVARSDFFAPQKYILASMFGSNLPVGIDLEWRSELPSHSGLGSGGAAFTSMVATLAHLLPQPPTLAERAGWAHRGDIIAHGGVASALDTQTSLLGGVIRFTGHGLADQLSAAPGLRIVIGNTGVGAATAEVNSGVRRWLAERPNTRMHHFRTIGALSRAAIPLLANGDWDELGRLFNLNQLVLEKIGVSRPENDRLIEAALEAGAFGAKISGSGGGGIIIALTSEETQPAVVAAITAAGGRALTPMVAVPGVQVTP